MRDIYNMNAVFSEYVANSKMQSETSQYSILSREINQCQEGYSLLLGLRHKAIH